jgi:putative ABC transport system permease protein
MGPPEFPPAVVLLGELRAHPGRTLIGVLAIAIGVAMGYAVHLINHAALDEFSQAVRSLMGNADVEIRGPRAGFDETLYPRVAALPEVTAASPVVEVDARLPEQREPLKILGIDVFRAGAVQPNLIGLPAEGSDRLRVLDPNALFLSPAAMAWLGVKAGDSLAVQIGLALLRLEVAGTVPAAGEGLRIGVMDIGAAQWRFDRVGVLHRLDIKLRPGVAPDAFADAMGGALPAGVAVTTPEDNVRRTSNLSRAYRVNLNVLALVALFTGSFLVFTTQALSVVRRRAQIALLRVLGVTRAGVLRQLVAEGLVQGVLGSVLGMALGFAAASLVLAYAGADLGGGFFPGVQPAVRFEPTMALAFGALGLAAALAGSLAPAWEAARARPAQALKAGDEEVALSRLRTPWGGVAMITTGLALTRVGPVDGLPVFGYIAIALLLIGGIMLMPWVSHLLFMLLPSGWRAAPYLAVTQLTGAPGRASVGLAGILSSFSLMVAMAIMVASFRTSVDNWLAIVLPADLYLRAGPAGDTAYFAPEVQNRIAATPGVARAEFQRSTHLALDPRRPPVTLIVRAIDAANPGARLPLVGAPVTPRPGDPPPVWVSEAMVDLYDFATGRRVHMPLAGQSVEVLVAGVWRDYARQHGALVMRQEDYRRVTGDTRANEAALWLEGGTGPAQAAARLRGSIDGGERVEFAEPGEIRAVSLKIFDRSFAVTYLLEAVAIVIGLFGIAASFGGQALARSREFGMLRHIGVTRRQIGAMLAIEGALLAALGVAAGLLLGWVVALILIHVVNPQSFHWTMGVHMPWGLLATVAAALVAAAALTALASGRWAMSAQAVRAVREDW